MARDRGALLRGAAPTIATATDEGSKLLLEQPLYGRTDILPQPIPEDLEQRIKNMLAAETIPLVKIKKGREVHSDLRPDLVDLQRLGDELVLTLVKGSPLQMAATLLDCEVEKVRKLGVCKTAIVLKP